MGRIARPGENNLSNSLGPEIDPLPRCVEPRRRHVERHGRLRWCRSVVGTAIMAEAPPPPPVGLLPAVSMVSTSSSFHSVNLSPEHDPCRSARVSSSPFITTSQNYSGSELAPLTGRLCCHGDRRRSRPPHASRPSTHDQGHHRQSSRRLGRRAGGAGAVPAPCAAEQRHGLCHRPAPRPDPQGHHAGTAAAHHAA